MKTTTDNTGGAIGIILATFYFLANMDNFANMGLHAVIGFFCGLILWFLTKFNFMLGVAGGSLMILLVILTTNLIGY